MYVGRVAVEKNIGAFLALGHPGTQVVVCDGPPRAELERPFPAVLFAGARPGEALAAPYPSADLLVFPRRPAPLRLTTGISSCRHSGCPTLSFSVCPLYFK